MDALTAIGLMSGTSLDGVDVALIETDGERVRRFGPAGYRAYDEAERTLLRAALAAGPAIRTREERGGVLAQAEAFVTAVHAQAVEAFLRDHGIDRTCVDIVGFHGQTVLHRPAAGLTVQIGDGAALAARLCLPVAYDFRAADVAAGGQGAPLVPVFHRALAEEITQAGPVAVLNVGGVANVTYVAGGHDPLACDTGPGNALLDDFMRERTGIACDYHGAAAARGRADEAFITRVLSDSFFGRPCPKSLDRNAFAAIRLPELSLEDGAATLTALTAAAVGRVPAHLPQSPERWIVSGGGARNPTLLAMLAAHLAPARVETADACGWQGDALEAQAFAFLAVRTLRGLPLTFPTTTGAPHPLPGGIIARPPVDMVG